MSRLSASSSLLQWRNGQTIDGYRRILLTEDDALRCPSWICLSLLCASRTAAMLLVLFRTAWFGLQKEFNKKQPFWNLLNEQRLIAFSQFTKFPYNLQQQAISIWIEPVSLQMAPREERLKAGIHTVIPSSATLALLNTTSVLDRLLITGLSNNLTSHYTARPEWLPPFKDGIAAYVVNIWDQPIQNNTATNYTCYRFLHVVELTYIAFYCWPVIPSVPWFTISLDW